MNGCCSSIPARIAAVHGRVGGAAETPSSRDSALSLGENDGWVSMGDMAYDDVNRRFFALGTWNSNTVLVAGDATGTLDPSFGADGTGRVAFPLSRSVASGLQETAGLLVDEYGSVATFRAPSGGARFAAALHEIRLRSSSSGAGTRLDYPIPALTATCRCRSPTRMAAPRPGISGLPREQRDSPGPRQKSVLRKRRMARIRLPVSTRRGSRSFSWAKVPAGEPSGFRSPQFGSRSGVPRSGFKSSVAVEARVR